MREPLEMSRSFLPAPRRAWIAAACVAIAVLGVAAYVAMRNSGARARSEMEILAGATKAVGRVHAVEMSGRTRSLGLAFAIAPGRLAMPCTGLAPGTELVFRIGPRDAPARVLDAAGKHGYCLVATGEAGSWPLAVAGGLPAVGDRVYATRVSDSGDVSLVEGRVEGIEREPRGAVLRVSGPAAHQEAGGPLLDARGRALAIADGRGRLVPIDAGDARHDAQGGAGDGVTR